MADNKIFKGIQQIKGFNDDGSEKELELENGILYLVRTNKDSNDEGYLYFNGKRYGDGLGGSEEVNGGEY